MLKFIFAWLLWLVCIGCQSDFSPSIQHSSSLATFSGQAMTIAYKIMVGHPLADIQAKRISEIIETTFNEIHITCNKWNPASELSQLNQLKADVKKPLSPLLERALRETDLIVRLTEGRFDPTIEPLAALWKQKLQTQQIPTEQELALVKPAIGWHLIHFRDGIFFKDHDLTQLDLGGMAKGLCIDLLIERLQAAGYINLFVEWGGEIRASGVHPDQRPWTVFISRFGDERPQTALATLSLDNQALATSGDYLQNWLYQPNNAKSSTLYFHVFDPKNLKPLESNHCSIASASVLAPTCAFADGLATAALFFPNLHEAEAWVERMKLAYPELSFWLVCRQKNGENE